MSDSRPVRARIRILLAAACFLAAGERGAAAATFPAGAGDDVRPSMGKFAIWVDPDFRSMVQPSPCYSNFTKEFVSPLLFDTATEIGRSAPYTDGGATDVAGPSVGTDAVAIPRSVFFTPPYLLPTLNFMDGPAGTNEVRTRVKMLDMASRDTNFRVRAGNLAGVTALSPGQVEDTNPSPTDDFPAESFFDIFAEIDVTFPGFAGPETLETDAPLLITNPSLPGPLPPDVVYIHGETPAVPVRWKTGPNQGRIFGYLRLAGHGISFECQCNDPNNPGRLLCAEPDCLGEVPAGGPPPCPDAQTLIQALREAEPMSCPQCIDSVVPALGATGMAVLLLLLLAAGTFFILRRARGASSA
jgi:hypothetical protein